jgi:hypothetical protein
VLSCESDLRRRNQVRVIMDRGVRDDGRAPVVSYFWLYRNVNSGM